MPPYPQPPQGALSAPPGMPPQGPMPGGPPPMGAGAPPMPGAAPAPGLPPGLPQAPPAPPPMPSGGLLRQPGNEGLINRVLGLIKKGSEPPPTNVTDQLRAMTELGMHKPQDASAGLSMREAPQGADPMASIRQQLQGEVGNDPMSAIRMMLQGRGNQSRFGGPLAMARGGFPMHLQGMMGLPQRSFAEGNFVRDDGQGNGRSDHVPARLSPGEFVMDATTVSLLGDGDSAAGARKLEDFRRNVRQHVGGALAKGKFPPNARPATSYLDEK